MTNNIYTKTIPAGERIFAEGTSGDVAYIIESGQVEISTDENGETTVLGVLNPGQIFGEMALIDDAPRTATASAITEAVLTVVSREQLMQRLDNAEPMLRMLIKVIIARYRSGLSQTRGSSLENVLNSSLPVADMTDQTAELAVDKLRLETDLIHALENNELMVYFQPLLNMHTGKWAGFEALTRWDHPERGAISPAEFITLAEETSLIIPIGLYVLQQACKNMVKLQTVRNKACPDASPMFIGVNVSTKQIAESGFIEEIAQVVKSSGLPAASLKLEITESIAVDYQQVINWVTRCKQLGFTVAIDDFGTGYSSMEHLLELDIDTLKIDQAFVKSMHANPRAAKLVKGMVSLSKALGYSIVAEGLETELDVTVLKELQVDYGQGYFIGKPQTFDEVLQQLTDGA